MMEHRSRADFENWGEKVSPESIAGKLGGREPVVFNFRPTEYILVDETHRDDWQKLFDEHAEKPAGEMLRMPNGPICMCVCDSGVDDFDSYY
jgi:hypothetical protein